MKHAEWLPNFLGIGGTRCGSTWLHYGLLRHPQMWLPPIKELHYFDRSPDYESPSYLGTSDLSKRMFGSEKHNRDWRRRATRDMLRCLTRQTTTLPWKIKYYFGNYNHQWYASLFEAGRDKVRGEITPAYSILTVHDVAQVHELLPEAKIILFLRNPIDRIWSGCRKKFITEAEIRKRLAYPRLDPRSDFVSILSKWSAVYPKEQFLVDFYEEVEAHPEDLLRKVYQFLGVDASDKYIWPELRRRHNSSPPKPMPAELKLALARKYESQVAELSEMFGGYATAWLDDVRATLGRGGRSTEAA